MAPNSSRLEAVFADIDEANARDPRHTVIGDERRPQELVYAERMSECLKELYPQASEALQIAARGQHIRRWEIPREDYPLGRIGYNQWRTTCREHHAKLVADIMGKHGYGEEEIAQVSKIIKKEKLKRDPESQALENVVCIVFVKYYLAEFAEKHDAPKLVEVLRKTALKMDDEGIAALKALSLPPQIEGLLAQALK